MESGLSSPRIDKFPAGLRVLVVDDDLTWLKILEKMLKKCSYHVTTCCLARDALNILREKKDRFDIVISDVNMPDMDGFKLLERVGLEMDLPVIMMSVDGETSRVMRGVQHGACDYLLKPIRMKELSNIWQHVYRKKMHEAKNTENQECLGNILLLKDESDDLSVENQPRGANSRDSQKRKDERKKRHGDLELVDSPSSKKPRVVWSIELHQKFLDAVNHIGLDKLGPKKILDTMQVPGLTRDNVASHLQKFRLYLNRLQNENQLEKSPGCLKQQEISSGNSLGTFDFQNSSSQIGASKKYGYTTNEIRVDDMGMEFHEGELKGMVSFSPGAKPKNPVTSDLPDHWKANIHSQMKPAHSLNLLDQSFKYQPFDKNVPPIQVSYPQQKGNFYLQPHSSTKNHLQADLQGYKSAINSISLSADHQLTSPGPPIATPFATQGMNYPFVNQNCKDKWNPVEQNVIADEPALVSLEEYVQSGSLQGYCGAENHMNDYYSFGLMAELGFQAQQFSGTSF